MGRNLLWADGVKEHLHVVVGGEVEWGLLGVIGVHVALAHLVKPVLVVAFAVLFLVLGLDSEDR